MFKKYPFVLQNGAKDCGPAALLMIIKYYGGYINLDELSVMLNTNRSGTNAFDMIETLKELGFCAKGVKATLSELNTENIILPCIAYVTINNSYKHFIVIYQIDFNKKKLIIADPQDKIKKITFKEFDEIWNNILLIMSPVKPILMNKDNSLFQFCFMLIKAHYRELTELIIISLLITVFSIFSSFYFKYIVNGINFDQTYLMFIFLVFALIYLLKSLTEFFRMKMLIHLNQKLDARLTIDSFNNIISLPYHYYRNRTTGELISRINSLNSVREMISKVAISLFIDLPLTIVALVFLYFISSNLFIISIIIMLFYLLVVILFKDILNNKISDVLNQKAQVNSLMVESISGFETVKGLNLEQTICLKFEKSYIKLLKKVLDLDNLCANQMFLKDLFGTIGQVVILFVGALLILNNLITLGTLLTFNAILTYFLTPMKNIIDLDYNIKEAKNALKKLLNSFLDNKEKGIIKKFSNGDITLKGLSFELNHKEVLKKIDLRIPRGNKVMLSGNSGSGKSTLLKILMQYYEVNRGSVYINKIDINDYYNVRNNICYISQQEVLFTDTIYNNIMLGNNNDKKFLEVKDICCIEDILDNTGFNMLIEENGFNISGGQKQRIVLARSLVHHFDILLIDEGLSQMDIDLERKILKRMFKKFKDKTIIIISHRLENMDLYDQFIELNNGTIKRNVIKNA